MRKWNIANKLSFSRIVLTILIVFILLFPFEQIGLNLPIYTINSKVNVTLPLRNIIAGVLFVIAAFTDFLDGHIARKNNLITDLGKMLDAIADKVLVNTVLVAFVALNYLDPIVAVIIIFRDIIVDSIKMQAASKGTVIAAIKTGKIKTAAMLTGLTLKFFSNIPFEFWGLRVSDVLIYFAVIMSIVSMFEYIGKNKQLFVEG